MAILVDTNILLRSVQPDHPANATGVSALATLIEREEPLVVAIQNIAEFWNVATPTTAWDSRSRKLETSSSSWKNSSTFFAKIRIPMPPGRTC
jgi:hypothetical protein